MPQIDKEVPQTEFSLKPFLSQAQLLLVLFGTSDRYQNKCTEVGHNGQNQQRNNGKYRGKESKIGTGNIVDILEKKFMVQSGSKPAFFCVYIKRGFSPCPVGITVAPSKHNSSIFKFFGWLSLVLFLRLTHARELYTISYHGAIYIPFLPAHMYRNNGEPYSDHQVEQFIKDKFYPDCSNVMMDRDGTIFYFGERC